METCHNFEKRCVKSILELQQVWVNVDDAEIATGMTIFIVTVDKHMQRVPRTTPLYILPLCEYFGRGYIPLLSLCSTV